ncbi:acyl carrier protein [Streptomyces sp. NPDC018019]|uniref:acyl carrier protein n=1 Tax=Streptomyces sp. NPDC018019 TaxID=3365030 RepID=UPI0037AFA963
MSEAVLPEELRNKVREIIADVLEADADELTEESSFVGDFDADSLLVIEMYSRFERDLGIKVPQEDAPELDSLPATYAHLAKYAPEAAGV